MLNEGTSVSIYIETDLFSSLITMRVEINLFFVLHYRKYTLSNVLQDNKNGRCRSRLGNGF